MERRLNGHIVNDVVFVRYAIEAYRYGIFDEAQEQELDEEDKALMREDAGDLCRIACALFDSEVSDEQIEEMIGDIDTGVRDYIWQVLIHDEA